MSVLLEKLRVGATERLSVQMVESLRFDTFTDYLTDSMLLRLVAEVQAQRLADETVTETARMRIATPATTWQMFKDTHRSSWWLRRIVRRWPVKTTLHEQTATLTACWTGWAKFPDSTLVVSDPRLGAPVYFSRVNTAIDNGSPLLP